jgi:hypothetical protein
VNCGGKQTTIPIVDKIDLRPGIQCPFDAGAKPPVWQNSFGCIRNKDWVADNGITVIAFNRLSQAADGQTRAVLFQAAPQADTGWLRLQNGR